MSWVKLNKIVNPASGGKMFKNSVDGVGIRRILRFHGKA